MSKYAFAEFINSNSRDTDQLHQQDKKGDKMAGAQIAFNIPYIKMFYAPVHYEGSNAFVSEEALEDSLNKFSSNQTASKHGVRTATYDSNTKTYIFTWTAYPNSGYKGKRYVNEASRKHIPDLLKTMGQKPKKGTDKIIGAHVEASAFLSVLRKGMHAGVITEQQADRYLKAFMEGNLHEVLTTEEGKQTTEPIKGQNIKTVTSEDEIGMTYEQFKEINEATHKVNLKTEVMFPQPAGANSDTAIQFEKRAIQGLKDELNTLADKNGIKWIEVEGSVSTVGMYQEIIAAKLLGKPAPKYNTKHKVGKKGQRTKNKTGQIPVPKGTKGKRQQSQVEKVKFRNNLRNMRGQFASPTALRALLNKKLPSELVENMGYPRLENVTGRFAQSVRIVNITHGNKNAQIPTVQYTYDQDPYSVFEMGAKGNRKWATPDRDPRLIIDATIREIAQEMMVNKFNTQRL